MKLRCTPVTGVKYQASLTSLVASLGILKSNALKRLIASESHLAEFLNQLSTTRSICCSLSLFSTVCCLYAVTIENRVQTVKNISVCATGCDSDSLVYSVF